MIIVIARIAFLLIGLESCLEKKIPTLEEYLPGEWAVFGDSKHYLFCEDGTGLFTFRFSPSDHEFDGVVEYFIVEDSNELVFRITFNDGSEKIESYYFNPRTQILKSKYDNDIRLFKLDE